MVQTRFQLCDLSCHGLIANIKQPGQFTDAPTRAEPMPQNILGHQKLCRALIRFRIIESNLLSRTQGFWWVLENNVGQFMAEGESLSVWVMSTVDADKLVTDAHKS